VRNREKVIPASWVELEIRDPATGVIEATLALPTSEQAAEVRVGPEEIPRKTCGDSVGIPAIHGGEGVFLSWACGLPQGRSAQALVGVPAIAEWWNQRA